MQARVSFYLLSGAMVQKLMNRWIMNREFVSYVDILLSLLLTRINATKEYHMTLQQVWVLSLTSIQLDTNEFSRFSPFVGPYYLLDSSGWNSGQ